MTPADSTKEQDLDKIIDRVGSAKIDPDTQRYNITNKLLWGIFILIVLFFIVAVLAKIFWPNTGIEVKDILGLILNPITSIIGFVLGYYFKER